MQQTNENYANTAYCCLRMDGKVIINRTCHIGVSGDTREWAMNGVAEVYMNHENHDLSDRPFYARFQRHGRWLNYGRVETVDAREEHICWGNKRFHMCFSQPYLICDQDGNLRRSGRLMDQPRKQKRKGVRAEMRSKYKTMGIKTENCRRKRTAVEL